MPECRSSRLSSRFPVAIFPPPVLHDTPSSSASGPAIDRGWRGRWTTPSRSSGPMRPVRMQSRSSTGLEVKRALATSAGVAASRADRDATAGLGGMGCDERALRSARHERSARRRPTSPADHNLPSVGRQRSNGRCDEFPESGGRHRADFERGSQGPPSPRTRSRADLFRPGAASGIGRVRRPSCLHIRDVVELA